METFSMRPPSGKAPPSRLPSQGADPRLPGTNCEYELPPRPSGTQGSGAGDHRHQQPERRRHCPQRGAVRRGTENRPDGVHPGGFSGGDEPDGSGKFITAFFRNAAVKRASPLFWSSGRFDVPGICNLPGADQASGALRQDHRHRRDLPHPDLQQHFPPPERHQVASNKSRGR